MAESLERETELYKKLLPTTLAADEGKFALISGDQLVGVFETYADALKVGYEKFGLQPFMVKQIAAIEVMAYFTRDLGSACLT
jgi:hypothetical protein